MICRVCEQWNPDGAERCSFCHNAPGAAADETGSAERHFAATSPPRADLPAVAVAAPPASAPARGGRSARRQAATPGATLVAWAAGVLVGGFVLLILARACGGR